jgi:hypothetical protein
VQRCPRFGWLSQIFSDSEVARYNATEQVTRKSQLMPVQGASAELKSKPSRQRPAPATREAEEDDGSSVETR